MNSKKSYYKNFSFNYLKHHLLHSKKYVREYNNSSSNEKNIKYFVEELKTIGNNITDIYTGKLSICNIKNELYYNLTENNNFEYNNYLRLFLNKDYFKIKISDNSGWILRMGKTLPEYIHIHPSRVGGYTVRFPANTWKTALLCYFFKLNETDFKFEINTINYLRTTFLELSPVKRINQKGNINEAFNLLLKT